MAKIDFPKAEKEILRFWEKERIFEKSIKKRRKKKDFVFYEGPPTANGKPGIHHLLSRVFKDIICRYKTMQGFRVERKAGWDTHGLPVELEVEKKLGIREKKEIEKFGIAKFNRLCKNSVWEYKKEWDKFTKRSGYWLDLKHPYITYQTDYIESLWFILKKIWERGLLYNDFRVSPYCPRCQTILSSHELAQGYKRIKEPAIYVKFQVVKDSMLQTDSFPTYLLVWTTTPWTLPGNVGIAVNPKIDYVLAKTEKEAYILAKKKLALLEKNYKIVKELKGEELTGLKYLPLYAQKISGRGYEVIPADFVSTEEGTGLVHIAPAFGEDDIEAIKSQNQKIQSQGKKGFPILLTVDEEGRMKTPGYKWNGLFVKRADPLIIEDLKERNFLFKKELYEHDYPFCWRCHTPLLYFAKRSWFIRMTEVKKNLIENNQKINWIPEHIKEGRFGQWLKEVREWGLSRERYWGTPLPIWRCKKCNRIEVIGSLEDLLRQKFSTNNYFLFRHGHSLRQITNLINCWPEKKPFPLTEKGRKQVLRSARKLKKENIHLIFSSDILRAKQTSQIIAKETGAKIIFDKRLRELNGGIFNGKNPQEFWNFLSNKKNPYSARVPKGESLNDVRKRVYGLIKEIDQKYQGKNIVIVSHEFPLTVLEKTLEGMSIEDIVAFRKEKRKELIKTGQWRRIKFRKLPLNPKGEIDLHRPYIDQIKFFCPSCGKVMERVPEVADCWFDSGSMPFAQCHWPFDKEKKLTKSQKLKPPRLFPADYICEGIDQTRGWFYTLLAISTALGFGPPYKNAISLGHVLDEKGEKMSKSKGNVIEPGEIIEEYGADAVRWYFYTINQPGDPKPFSKKDVQTILRKFILTFWNCYSFFATYSPSQTISENLRKRKSKMLDRWIVSKLNNLISQTKNALDRYDITEAARAIENFVINDLSLWYIRRSRKRFQRPENKKEIKEASQTLGFVLLTLSRLVAPFIPFLSEKIYRSLSKSRESVHLENWPKVKEELIDKNLEEKMKKVRSIVKAALAERAKAKIKTRQPLNKLKIRERGLKIEKELIDLIKEEVNVKEVVFDKNLKKEVELDTKITAQLKEEGILREIIRNIQDLRKRAGLGPKDTILIAFQGQKQLEQIILKNQKRILEATLGKEIKRDNQAGRKIEIEGKPLQLRVKKIKR